MLLFVTMCCGSLSRSTASMIQSPDSFGFGFELILAKLEALEARMFELEKFHHHLNNSLQALNSSCSAPFKTLDHLRTPITGGLSPIDYRHRPYDAAVYDNYTSGRHHYYSANVNYTTRYGVRNDSDIGRHLYSQIEPLNPVPTRPYKINPSWSSRNRTRILERVPSDTLLLP